MAVNFVYVFEPFPLISHLRATFCTTYLSNLRRFKRLLSRSPTLPRNHTRERKPFSKRFFFPPPPSIDSISRFFSIEPPTGHATRRCQIAEAYLGKKRFFPSTTVVYRIRIQIDQFLFPFFFFSLHKNVHTKMSPFSPGGVDGFKRKTEGRRLDNNARTGYRETVAAKPGPASRCLN